MFDVRRKIKGNHKLGVDEKRPLILTGLSDIFAQSHHKCRNNTSKIGPCGLPFNILFSMLSQPEPKLLQVIN